MNQLQRNIIKKANTMKFPKLDLRKKLNTVTDSEGNVFTAEKSGNGYIINCKSYENRFCFADDVKVIFEGFMSKDYRKEIDRILNKWATEKAEPVVAEPVVAEPVVAEPVVAEPVVAEPTKGYIIMHNQIVTSTNSKNIILPFNGLYQSILGTELDSSIEYESYNSQSASDNIEKINDLIYDNLDNKGFNRKLCAIYADTLAEVINYEFDTDLHFSSVEYAPLNGQNVGDNLECIIDVDCLPSIKDIAELSQTSIDDVWDKLQELSNEQFSSCSGFISFYETDLTILHGVDYDNWNEGYIMLIIQLLLNEACKDIGDIEQQTIENINNDYGNVLELAYSCISDDSVINELNKLFDY